ncbi:MAG: COR domain-containing protein [Acidobacteriota bacterium]|nr:COR domain-containing protein [Acidobacteriota bacterium]
MSDDLAVIKALERQVGRRIKRVEEVDVYPNSQNEFQLSEEGKVIRLNLSEMLFGDFSRIADLKDLEHLGLAMVGWESIKHLTSLSKLIQVNLGNNRIQDITPLASLTALTRLFLFNNEVQDVTPLASLTALTVLGLWGNQIQDITPLASLTALTELDLRRNQIQDITPLASLTALTMLDLHSNQIKDVTPLASLTALTMLNLSNNQIQDIGPLASLTALFRLRLSKNQIQDAGPLASLTTLNELRLSNNQIQDVTPLVPILERFGTITESEFFEGLSLGDNPLKQPPMEIVRRGKKDVLAWFEAQTETQRPLNEVKVLLVGAGGAGKTSLVKAIKNEEHDPKEEQTHGIRRETWTFTRDNREINARLWDFGGQEIMHATHQFFMSHRSLYVLVLDGRKEGKPEEYWLKHIGSFGGDSPILVVINKIDQNPGFDVDRRALRRKYPGIAAFHRVSCESREGIDAFRSSLCTALANVPMVSSTWPETWFQAKTALENLDKPYISYDAYRALCRDRSLTAENQQETLLHYLHDLGVALHFPELEWLDTQVLQPTWITNAVYTIINHRLLADGQGIFTLNQLKTILPEFPKDRYPFLIALMKKFELCFGLDKANHILVPDLLPVGEPELPEEKGDTLHFAVNYHFLPRSVMPRLIVNLHKDIHGGLCWRTGVVLQHPQIQARAVVRVDYDDDRLTMEVTGGQRREYLAVVLHCLRGLHGRFEKIGAKEHLRCTCAACQADEVPHEHRYDHLLEYRKNGMTDVPCPLLKNLVPIDDLLEGTFGPPIKGVADMIPMLEEIAKHFNNKETGAEVAKKILEVKPGLLGVSVNVGEAVHQFFKKRGG